MQTSHTRDNSAVDGTAASSPTGGGGRFLFHNLPPRFGEGREPGGNVGLCFLHALTTS